MGLASFWDCDELNGLETSLAGCGLLLLDNQLMRLMKNPRSLILHAGLGSC